MSTDEPRYDNVKSARRVDMKLEVAVLPVSDVDRSKSFYRNLGWQLDADFTRKDGSRAVQLTPPGSPASIHLGGKFHLGGPDRSRAAARRDCPRRA